MILELGITKRFAELLERLINALTHSYVADRIDSIDEKTDRILEQLSRMETNTVADFTELRDELARNTSATNSIRDLVTRLLDEVDDAEDIAQVREITAAFRANTDTLIAATAAGTPIENEPPAEPTTEPEPAVEAGDTTPLP